MLIYNMGWNHVFIFFTKLIKVAIIWNIKLDSWLCKILARTYFFSCVALEPKETETYTFKEVKLEPTFSVCKPDNVAHCSHSFFIGND